MDENPYKSPTIPADRGGMKRLHVAIIALAIGLAGGYSLGYLHGFSYSRYWDGPPVRRNGEGSLPFPDRTMARR